LLAVATVNPDGKVSPDPARLRGAAVLVSLESGADLTLAPNYVVMRSRTAQQLAAAGAAAMLIPSDKPGRMLYTSAAGLYPRAPRCASRSSPARSRPASARGRGPTRTRRSSTISGRR